MAFSKLCIFRNIFHHVNKEYVRATVHFRNVFKRYRVKDARIELLPKMSKIQVRSSYFSKSSSALLDKQSYLNKKSSKGGIGLTGYILFGLPSISFVLGIWQIKRKFWKQELISDLELKLYIPTIDLPYDLTDRSLLEYRKVRVKGHFDHSKEMYIGPRSRIDIQSQSKSSLFTDSSTSANAGYLVITPFVLSDRPLTILVNRGWVPNDKKDPITRLESQIEGEIELEGVVRLREDKPRFLPEYNSYTNVFSYRDLSTMAELANSSYLYIDALKTDTTSDGPIGGQTNINIKDDHVEYACTWFSITAITGYLWYKRFILRKI